MALQRINAAQIQVIKVKASQNPNGLYFATQSGDGKFFVRHYPTLDTTPIDHSISKLPPDTDWVLYSPSTQELQRR